MISIYEIRGGHLGALVCEGASCFNCEHCKVSNDEKDPLICLFGHPTGVVIPEGPHICEYWNLCGDPEIWGEEIEETEEMKGEK